MEPNQATTTRLFPRGTTPLALATAFAALCHIMALGCLYGFVVDAAGLAPDEGRIAWNLYSIAAILFYVVGGVWGDFGGHRRNLIIGPAITAAALLLLMITPDSGDAGAALVIAVALSAFACGRSLFGVAGAALAAHLHEESGSRVPLAGTYTLLHLAANAAVLLLAPFASTSIEELLGDAFGMGRGESQRLLFFVAAQAAIGALIVAAVARRSFATAELGARAKVAARDPAPLDDGAIRYRPAAIGLVAAAAALGFGAYDAAMNGAYDLAARLGGGGGWFDALQVVNGAIVVFLAPVAVIVYGRMRRGASRVPTAGLAAVGAALIGVGLTLLLAAAAMTPASGSEFAPPWLEEAPSIAWPIAAQILVSLGEILLIPLFSALIASLAPRRLRGLFLGGGLALAGAVGLLTRFADEALDGVPLTGSTAIALGAALGCAALLAVAGTVFRKRETA
jgi:dipeptide/tripeptide permease